MREVLDDMRYENGISRSRFTQPINRELRERLTFLFYGGTQWLKLEKIERFGKNIG